VKRADDFRTYGRIDASQRVAGLNTFAADDQRVLAAEFALHFLERRAHGLRVFFFGEISKWFVAKFSWH
jgi:hypothetical protein